LGGAEAFSDGGSGSVGARFDGTNTCGSAFTGGSDTVWAAGSVGRLALATPPAGAAAGAACGSGARTGAMAAVAAGRSKMSVSSLPFEKIW
jgi:hypothetical protein